MAIFLGFEAQAAYVISSFGNNMRVYELVNGETNVPITTIYKYSYTNNIDESVMAQVDYNTLSRDFIRAVLNNHDTQSHQNILANASIKDLE